MDDRIQTKNIHALYLASVQDPINDVKRISAIYQEIFQAKPLLFREDFSGTFALSCCWVESDDKASAIAIDWDRETLDYGKKNYLENLTTDQKKRLEVIEGNAIVKTTPVDIIGVFNFSYCLIHHRSRLLKYFKKCHDSLRGKGMLILDIFGGSDSEVPEVQERFVDNSDQIMPFFFEFERKSFNPINRLADYAIHFKYQDGLELIDAYTYKFRMWSLTEIRDLLEEAGFSESFVYWENTDENGYGNGNFYQTKEEENSINWNAYIVGKK